MSTALKTSLLLPLLLCCTAHAATAFDTTPRKTLTAFASEQALKAWLDKLAAQQLALQRRTELQMKAMPMPAPMASSASKSAEVSGAVADSVADAVTNTQTAGVDEGGIVKVHGKHLVMLRRGKLFTVNVGQQALRPLASLDAFAPGSDPSDSWYDEMLVSGDTVVVIGYSYSRGGTEVGLFDIDAAGRLAYRATYHLRSNDY